MATPRPFDDLLLKVKLGVRRGVEKRFRVEMYANVDGYVECDLILTKHVEDEKGRKSFCYSLNCSQKSSKE